jgi:ABC-type amino acid transport substrate-binding protein
MTPNKLKIAFCFLLGIFSFATHALDLPEIKSKGEIRHLGIPYANFVTGAGDGFDVELMQGFAKHIDVKYVLVYTDFYSVVKDLLGKNVSISNGKSSLDGNFPIKGDVISTGFTHLPWREQILLFSDATFPSQVVLIARPDNALRPIVPSKNLLNDVDETKKLIGQKSLLVMERTCLDPANYGLKGAGYNLVPYVKSANINEIVPALINKDAELSLLDVPDLLIDLKKWPGKFKVLGPISEEQILATAFPKDAPLLRGEFNLYLTKIKLNGTYDLLVDKYYPGIRSYFPKFFAKN